MSESSALAANGFCDFQGNTFPMLICGCKGAGKQSIAISFLKGFYNSDFHSTLFSTIESNTKTLTSQPSNNSSNNNNNSSLSQTINSSSNANLSGNSASASTTFETKAARRKSIIGSSASRAAVADDLTNIETSIHFLIKIHRGEEFNNFHLQLQQQEKDATNLLYCSKDFYTEVKFCNIFLLLYSIVDRHSFEYCTKLAKQIVEIKRNEFNRRQTHTVHDAYFSSPIFLFVGNKADLSLTGSRSIVDDESQIVSKEEVIDFVDSFILESVMVSSDASKSSSYFAANQGVVQLSQSGDVHQMNKTLENEKSKILHFEVSVLDNDVQFILNELWEKIRLLNNTELEAKLIAKFKQWNSAALEVNPSEHSDQKTSTSPGRSRRKSVLQDLRQMFRKSLGLSTTNQNVHISKPLPMPTTNGAGASPRSPNHISHSAPVTPYGTTPQTTPSSTSSTSVLEEATHYHEVTENKPDDSRRTRRLSLLKNMAKKTETTTGGSVEEFITKPPNTATTANAAEDVNSATTISITSPRSTVTATTTTAKDTSSKRGFFGMFKKK